MAKKPRNADLRRARERVMAKVSCPGRSMRLYVQPIRIIGLMEYPSITDALCQGAAR